MIASIFNFLRMNIKKLLLSVFVFSFATLVIIVIFFPINNVATNYIDNYIAKANIQIKYETINLGYFGGKMSNVSIDDKVKVESITLKYSPLSVITKKISFNIVSDLGIIDGVLKNTALNVTGKLSLAGIVNIFKLEAAGSLDINADYALDNMTGIIKLSSTAVSLVHPMMTVNADTLNIDANINGMLLRFDKIEATGKAALNASGLINFNQQNINASLLDINGKADFMGVTSNFTLSGTFASPSFALQ